MSGPQHEQPLRRFAIDDFTLRLDGDKWGLYMEGLRYFWIDCGAVPVSDNSTQEELALMIFDKLLEVHCNAAQTGYVYGFKEAQQIMRTSLGIEQ